MGNISLIYVNQTFLKHNLYVSNSEFGRILLPVEGTNDIKITINRHRNLRDG